MKHGKEGKVAILIVYVDDIVVTGNDEAEIQNLKKHLASSFDIKALGLLSYFLGIKSSLFNVRGSSFTTQVYS